jgi:hypothetical protein
MNRVRTRRTAALALTAAITLGGSLAAAAPAGAISQTGGIGCSTHGVTVFVGYGYTSMGCFAGSAGSVGANLNGTGSVMGVWNHGYAQYYESNGAPDVTGFDADSLHYKYDDPDSLTYSVSIMP